MTTRKVHVGRSLPPTIVYVPRSTKRHAYLARLAPIAGCWGPHWRFDGVSLGSGVAVWGDDLLTRASGEHPLSPLGLQRAPDRVGLLLAHEGYLIPEGFDRLARCQQNDVAPLVAVFLAKTYLDRIEGTLRAHGSLFGFNMRGTPFTPKAPPVRARP